MVHVDTGAGMEDGVAAAGATGGAAGGALRVTAGAAAATTGDGPRGPRIPTTASSPTPTEAAAPIINPRREPAGAAAAGGDTGAGAIVSGSLFGFDERGRPDLARIAQVGGLLNLTPTRRTGFH